MLEFEPAHAEPNKAKKSMFEKMKSKAGKAATNFLNFGQEGDEKPATDDLLDFAAGGLEGPHKPGLM